MQAKKLFIGLGLLAGIATVLGGTSACTVTISCIGGEVDCGGVCVDTSTDPYDCGGCGNTCTSTQDCVQGVCKAACTPDGAGPCKANTADLTCCSGVCGSDGNCGCVSPKVNCGGVCTDIQNDPNFCGGCNTVCTATQDCVQGVCSSTCTPDGTGPCTPSTADPSCCSQFCASDGNCGCIPTGTAGCLGDIDCCSNKCDVSGICN